MDTVDGKLDNMDGLFIDDRPRDEQDDLRMPLPTTSRSRVSCIIDTSVEHEQIYLFSRDNGQ
jgi:hypothetical protein